MGKKRPEDEIQQKLVELELSIKDEELRQTPAVRQGGAQLVPGKKGQTSDSASTVKAGTVQKLDSDSQATLDLYNFGGVGLILVSALLVLGNIGLSLNWAVMWGSGTRMSLVLLPLFVGLGMLFYNYKSKIARYVTLGSVAAFFVMLVMNLTFTFRGLSLLEFILMSLPMCAGFALLAKAQVKRRELLQGTKQIQ